MSNIFQIEVTCIDWDTYDDENGRTYSGKELGLPDSVLMLCNYCSDEEHEEEEIADVICEKLSRRYGYCVKGLMYLKMEIPEDEKIMVIVNE